MSIDRKRRLEIFYERLMAADPANSADTAKLLADQTLNGVEDEFSGIPFNPNATVSDGRLYPAKSDNARDVEGAPELTRYRHRGHSTYVAPNGAIRIETADGVIQLDKAGADGRKVSDYENDTSTLAGSEEGADQSAA